MRGYAWAYGVSLWTPEDCHKVLVVTTFFKIKFLKIGLSKK